MLVALVDFETEYDGEIIVSSPAATRSPSGHELHRRFPARKRRGQAASRFRSTMRAVPAIPAPKCAAGVVPVWSRG
jgi:hypothetical protein